MDKDDSNYCPHCGIHRAHASPGCVNHGQANPLAESHAKTPLRAIDATQSDEYLLNQFTDEAVAAGYDHAGAVKVARGRIENLRSGGDGYSIGTHDESAVSVASKDRSNIAPRSDAVGGTTENVTDAQRSAAGTAQGSERVFGAEAESRRT